MEIQTYKQFAWDNEQLLDKDNICTKEEVHEKGLLHLSSHLLVFRKGKDIEILCRKRAESELRYSGLWTTTIGTHVLLGSDYLTTLTETYHGKNTLEWVGEFRVHDDYENEINGLYIVEYTNDLTEDFFNNREFIPILKIQELIKQGKTTPHLSEAIKLFKEVSLTSPL